ncbi:MAG: RNA polymerase sigma-70 factor [Marinilabiliales bacterium]|nr:MAG: RNA polymerase sigma-70 factor [Marinilabiliales bacterium]
MKAKSNLFAFIKKSDEKAFEILFRLYYEPLVGFCVKIIQDKDLAKGLVQEVFISIWENRENLRPQSPSPYLYRAVKNKCFNYLRHQNVKQEFQNEFKNQDISEQVENDEINDKLILIHNSINKLPAQCKRIFIMSRMHGLKHKEIAEELGIAVKTVKNQIGKALKHLKRELTYLIICLIFYALKLF